MIHIKDSKAIVKDLSRVAVAAAGAIGVAVTTWTKGNPFGFNLQTLLGVLGTAAFPVIATVSKYLDKSDPAFGVVTDAAAKAAADKIAALTGAKPTA